ncbi:hypothetical protein [Photobacterium lipolyticum]|uniref:Gp5/Type VI secretion system Vgr protein OB-fold domain-containing protein n=1 Tax=Photobacterium lipolyticum TaxID=266810 RepID=A0A2T3N0C2_9GAMM|nr:hypothetical protein [Photobacterium lipolyticum]PSW05627.1 hypothetical protein C9I89_07710 [Photobacterium lipolyticum]
MDVNVIKRIIFRLFPEFTGQWHLPRWGKVVALPELPEEGDLSDRFYPHYAVDVQLLDEKGMEYEDKPPLQAVPLPVPGLGDHAGRLEPPAIGSIVELGFMFGQPDKPFIRCVLPLGFKLPAIKEGESRYQQRQGVYHHVDQDGNFESTTDKNATLNCIDRAVNATNYTAIIEQMRKIVVKQSEEITILKDQVQDIKGQVNLTVGKDLAIKAKNITEDADTIKLNGGKGVCTGASICPFMGKPHVDVSTTVFAGK